MANFWIIANYILGAVKKYFLLIFVLIAACSKEPAEIRTALLSVETSGTYLVTYGVAERVTVKGENNWATSLDVNPGDTIQLSAKTDELPATLYINVEVREGLLNCKSLYIKAHSVGAMNYIVLP